MIEPFAGAAFGSATDGDGRRVPPRGLDEGVVPLVRKAHAGRGLQFVEATPPVRNQRETGLVPPGNGGDGHPLRQGGGQFGKIKRDDGDCAPQEVGKQGCRRVQGPLTIRMSGHSADSSATIDRTRAEASGPSRVPTRSLSTAQLYHSTGDGPTEPPHASGRLLRRPQAVLCASCRSRSKDAT